MTNQTYNYVLVAHDGVNFYPVYSSNHRTVVENIMWAVCIQKDGFNKIDNNKLRDFLVLNRIKPVDQLENKEIPESHDWDWRIAPSHLLKKLEGNRWGWNMYLLTVPALNL